LDQFLAPWRVMCDFRKERSEREKVVRGARGKRARREERVLGGMVVEGWGGGGGRVWVAFWIEEDVEVVVVVMVGDGTF